MSLWLQLPVLFIQTVEVFSASAFYESVAAAACFV
jgi:hypothetical protein